MTASLVRPYPPPAMAELSFETMFVPAPDVETWVREQIIERGDLHNPDHSHLADCRIGFVWTAQGYVKAGRQILGTTEDAYVSRGNAWQKGRAEQQLCEWFGHVPRFLVTLDATHCSECSDVEFCALVEHELYHCGHMTDEFGFPAFGKDGLPKLGIKPHDVEEFVGVVARYGLGNPDGPIARMILAAAKGPSVAPIRVAQACGTCMLRAA